jgi:L-histidine Nalpha-methyltransferase
MTMGGPLDPRAYELLASEGLSPDPFNPAQHRSCELVERYAVDTALDLCGRLGVLDLLHAPLTAADLCAARGFVPEFVRPLRWLLERLATAGILTRANPGYRLTGPPPRPALAALREDALAMDASYAPAYDLLDAAASLYPGVARGEVQAERALFLRARLWLSYFDNANGYYALSNRVAACAAASRLVAAGGRVLEVGAGLGSATAALLGELRARGALGQVTGYHVTEPALFFRRRLQRTLEESWPGIALSFDGLDINRPWSAQGVEPGSCALVWGVNVFHLARRLEDALLEAHAALAPGGWLVVGEGLRPGAGVPVGAELPFQLLDSFHDVLLDPDTRPTAGFLTAELWTGALRRTGFDDIALVPDVIALRESYPGFLAAAVCGRRPPR